MTCKNTTKKFSTFLQLRNTASVTRNVLLYHHRFNFCRSTKGIVHKWRQIFWGKGSRILWRQCISLYDETTGCETLSKSVWRHLWTPLRLLLNYTRAEVYLEQTHQKTTGFDSSNIYIICKSLISVIETHFYFSPLIHSHSWSIYARIPFMRSSCFWSINIKYDEGNHILQCNNYIPT